jgi:hypothetical protein
MVFSGKDITSDISPLQAVFLPYRLCDLFLLAQAKTEKGNLLIYHGRVNWALPLSWYHDRYLMNALHPWDFGVLSPFRPTMLEGEVRIVGIMRKDTEAERAKLLMQDMPPLIIDAFDLKEAHLDWTQDYTRLHQYGQMMLPIWFLDRQPLSAKNRNDQSAKFAVNGQTGKVCCIINAGTEKEYIIEKPAPFAPPMSDESSLFSPPVPVVAKPGTFQYRPVPFEQALFNKPGLLGRLFGDKKTMAGPAKTPKVDVSSREEVQSSDVSFRMVIQSIYDMPLIGVKVSGKIETSSISTGEDVVIHKASGDRLGATVTSIEQFMKIMDVAAPGYSAWLTLKGIKKNEIAPGDIIVDVSSPSYQ